MRRHPRLQQTLSMLLRLWDAFELPPNPLDHLTELLGGPDKVRGHLNLTACLPPNVSYCLLMSSTGVQIDLQRRQTDCEEMELCMMHHIPSPDGDQLTNCAQSAK